MKKIISVLVLGYASLQPMYADELSDAIAKYQQACDKGDALSCNNLGFAFYQLGHYAKAKPLFIHSLEISEKALGKDHPDVATKLNNLAMLYQKQGNYNVAEPFFQRSLAILEKTLGKDHPNVAKSLNNLAALYQRQGNYSAAEPLFQRSLEISEKVLGKEHPDVATKLNNLATLYQGQGNYSAAEPLFQRSLAIFEKVLGKEHPDVATILNNLAQFYHDQGNYSAAAPLFQRSLAISEKVLGSEHLYVAQSLNNLAGLYKDQGKYNVAEPLYQRSLAILEKALGKEHPDIAIILDNLAMFYLTQDKQDSAKQLFARSLRLKNQVLNRWLGGAGEKTRQFYMLQEEANRNAFLSFYSLRNTAEEALYFSLSRKGLLLKIASEIGVLTKLSPEIKYLRTEISNLSYSNDQNKNEKIKVLEKKINILELQLLQNNSNFKRNMTELIPEQILKKLIPEQAVIDFLIFKEKDFRSNQYKTEQVIALIADKQNGIKLIKLGEFSPISKLIKEYRYFPTENEIKTQNFSTAREIEEYKNKFFEEKKKTLPKLAEQLYTLLWQPLTPYLENKKTVYLIPDGDLHLLPFKALQDKDGKYLAEKWQLITLSSARDIVLPPLEGKASAAAIFAAPDYGDDTAIIKAGNTAGASELKQIHFKPLASAFNEGQRLNQLFKNTQPTQLFTEKQATEQAINAVKAPKILHLSTHGFFLEDNKPDEKTLEHNRGFMRGLDEHLPVGKVENPLTRSGLAFANANFGVKGIKQADGTDGILTALEVLNLDLAGTDLVTLSACETGKGDVKIGEGVYSLNRAFQEAGAKAVLSTLWQVDDKATSEFMQKFYSRFLNGEPAQQAIQATQNEFMHDEKYKQYSNPYYWAGFVMTGKE